MATVPNPPHLAVTNFVDAAKWNGLVDAVNFANFPPSAFIYNNVGFDIPSSSTGTLVSYDSEEFDSDPNNLQAHSSSNLSKMICNYTATYRLHAGILFPAAATGTRQVNIRKNANGSFTGGTSIRTVTLPVGSTSATCVVTAERLIQASATDHFQVFGAQTSGSTLSISAGVLYCWFDMELVSG